MTLDELPPDSAAVVVRLHGGRAERRRMMDLGIVPGSEIRAERVSPLGDPTAYWVRGCLIALRRAQARTISVEMQAER